MCSSDLSFFSTPPALHSSLSCAPPEPTTTTRRQETSWSLVARSCSSFCIRSFIANHFTSGFPPSVSQLLRLPHARFSGSDVHHHHRIKPINRPSAVSSDIRQSRVSSQSSDICALCGQYLAFAVSPFPTAPPLPIPWMRTQNRRQLLDGIFALYIILNSTHLANTCAHRWKTTVPIPAPLASASMCMRRR